MERIKEFFRRIPLLAILVLTSCLLSLAAFAAGTSVYASYPVDPVREPWLTALMEGLHDGVFPWSRPDAEEAETGTGPEETSDPAAGAAEEEPEAAPAEDGKEDEAPAGDGEQTGGEEETEGPEASEEEETETPPAEPEEPAGDADPYDMDPDVDPSPTGKPLPALPENVSAPVVGAEDFGNADPIFLSPEDTVYNSDTKGLFGRTGTTYSFRSVDDSYFETALFIGDSRTTGFAEYGGLRDRTSFLSRDSVTVYTLLDHKLQFRRPGSRAEERYLEDVLRETPYDKIYIAIGVNELGIPDTRLYYEKYRKIVTMIHQLQPEAILYLQGSMHVSRKVAKGSDTYNNTIIVQRNKAIATLANGRSVFYLDMNGAVCDDKGNLIESYSGDGIHLFASKYGLWADYLRSHAIVRE